MAHYGTLRDYRFPETESADDIRGSSIYGREEEKLGKIDDVIFDHSTGAIRYMVVDTGGWLRSKKFLVPVDRVRPSTKHKDDYRVELTKEQIESFPPYNESDVASDERWKDYEKRYRDAWSNGPVQHKEGSDRNITPEATEIPIEPGASREPVHVDTSRIIPAGADEVTISNSGAGIGPRWSTFESRLRQRRRDITQGCTTCTVGPASDRYDESAEDERKAV
jgi:hypothetical protein